MMGKSIDGEEAEKIGLVNKAVDKDSLAQEVKKWSEEFLKIPPLAAGLGKRVMDKSVDMDMMASLDLTTQIQSMLLKSEDFVEGVKAKLEKRGPSFKGK